MLSSTNRRTFLAAGVSVSLALAGFVSIKTLITQNASAAAGTNHYLYVFPGSGLYAYDIDNGHKLVKKVPLPTSAGGRGVVADPVAGMLYISYGGNGGSHGNGSLLKYNLRTDKIVWTKNYNFGVDSMGITPDGKKLYMPHGSNQYDGKWSVLDTNDGHEITSFIPFAGMNGHNTLVGLSGKSVYLGAVDNNNLFVYDTTTNKQIRKIGPLKEGVRPFTVNGRETLAFTNATNFIGFQVGDINTGKILYTVAAADAGSLSGTSHGISLSPNEKEIYLVDAANSKVYVYDVRGLPKTAPEKVASIKVRSMPGNETSCIYDCHKEGWLLHSHDGRYVYVGDSGDVIDTKTRKSVVNIDTLFNSRQFIEIDWQHGAPVFATSRHGIGYVS